MTISKYDRNNPFNSMPLLPPGKEIENDPEILQKVIKASRSLAAVNINILRLPNPFLLVNTIALQEAKTSTEIENIFTTEDKLYKALSDTLKEENTDPATKEVLRYKDALWSGYRIMKEKNRIDLDLITTIFQHIKNTSAGIRPAQSLIVIKRGMSEFKSGEIIYTAPRGEGVLEKLMDNLIEYLNDDETFTTDPLLKMCIAHYQFEAIHPFQDGNGRTGRILNLLFLIQKDLLQQPTLYLSKYIIAHKDDYYHYLGTVTQRGLWKDWIMFMLEAVEKTADLTSNLINEILNQMSSTQSFAKTKIKWYNSEINEAIFSQPYIKPSVIGAVIGKTSRTTLTKYVGELVNSKILTPKKEGNEVYYLNDDLIRILQG